jgi:hypothetical protein
MSEVATNFQLGYTGWHIFILNVQPVQEAQNHLYLATSKIHVLCMLCMLEDK